MDEDVVYAIVFRFFGSYDVCLTFYTFEILRIHPFRGLFLFRLCLVCYVLHVAVVKKELRWPRNGPFKHGVGYVHRVQSHLIYFRK